MKKDQIKNLMNIALLIQGLIATTVVIMEIWGDFDYSLKILKTDGVLFLSNLFFYYVFFYDDRK